MSYKRSAERNRRLQKLSAATQHSYRGDAYYDRKKKRYVRFYLSKTGQAKWLRKVANKTVRRNDAHSHGHYRKLFDYWWELT